MRSLITSLLLVLTSLLFAQKPLAGYITDTVVIPLPELGNTAVVKIASSYKLQKVLFYNRIINDNNLLLADVDIRKRKVNDTIISLPKKVNDNYPITFTYGDSGLYFTNKDKLFAYQNGSIISVDEDFNYQFNNHLKVTNQVIYTGHVYDFKNPAIKHTAIGLKNEGKKKTINPFFEGIGITHTGSDSYIDFNGKYCLFGQSFKYEITIYDSLLNTIEVVGKNLTPKATDSFIKKMTNYTYIDETFEYSRDSYVLYSRILAVKFNTDTSFYVLYSKPKGTTNFTRPYQFYFDFWAKTPTGWQCTQEGLCASSFNEKGEEHSLIFEGMGGNTFDIINNKLVVLRIEDKPNKPNSKQTKLYCYTLNLN